MSTSRPHAPDAAPTCSDVGELGLLLRSRGMSPVELTDASLATLETADVELNTFLSVTDSVAEAAAADAEVAAGRGELRSPLHGIPIGIKDAIDVAGVRCTFGSRILADRVPGADADCVRAIRTAGAVIVGKQNLHEFAYGITGENPHYGDVANPRDPGRISGGSSAGTAAAIAAGIVPVGLGTDTGGSVRIPAALCGVVGLKPTYDLVGRGGVLPLAPSLDHVGSLGRSVLDCFVVLDVIAPGDRARHVDRAATTGLRGVRVGIPREHFFDRVEPEVETAVRQAIDRLAELEASVVEVSFSHLDEARPAGLAIMGAEAATWHARWLRERAADYGPDVRERLERGAAVSPRDREDAERRRALVREDFSRVFDAVDVVVGPTVPITAPQRGCTTEPSGSFGDIPRSVINRNTLPANLTGFPAITVPCGVVAGLPVGLQVMAAAHAEVTVGAVALAYERAVGRLPDPTPVA